MTAGSLRRSDNRIANNGMEEFFLAHLGEEKQAALNEGFEQFAALRAVQRSGASKSWVGTSF